MRVKSIPLHGIILASLMVTACASRAPVQTSAGLAPNYHEGHMGTLWVETAIEYDMVSTQAFALAELRLRELIDDPSATALTADGSPDPSLVPAVILDVDETVLDNSPYQSQLVLDQAEYSSESWQEWVELAEAKAIPGALEFIEAARRMGVRVFYVTNREASEEPATRRNLLEQGFPIDESVITDVVLTKGENGWGSDKESRRLEVAKDHRVVMLIGDDLNDFVSGARADNPESREQLASRYRDRWGRSWIVLPNPLYGSWEASLFARDFSLSHDYKMKAKERHLKGYRRKP